MPRPTTAAEHGTRNTPRMRVVLLTMDHHLAGAARGAARRLQQRMPGLSLEVHTAAQWRAQAQALAE